MSRLLGFSRQEITDLLRQARAGDTRARDHLVYGMLPLVISIARSHRNPAISVPDLVDVGVIGVLEAIDRCDMRRTTRFTAFARVWITASIRREIARASLVSSAPKTQYVSSDRLDQFEATDDRHNARILETVWSQVNTLPSLHQAVILGLYFDRMTREAVRQKIGVSSRRVDAIERESLALLRRMTMDVA